MSPIISPKPIKKIYLFVVIFLMASVFLAQCTTTPATQIPAQNPTLEPIAQESPTSDQNPTQPPTSEPIPTNPPASEPVTLEFWDYTNPGTYEPWWETFITEFQNSHPGVTIKRVPYAEKDYDNALRTAIAAGKEPDILFVISGAGLEDFAISGKIIPLDDLIDTSIWTPGLMEALSYNGSVYAVPLGPQPTPFWYNKQLFRDYNLNPPQTWDQLLAICDTFNQANIIPITLGGLERWEISMHYHDILNQMGGPDLLVKAGTGKASFTDPAFIKSANYVLEMFDRKCFPEEYIGMDFNAMSQAFMNGDAAMEVMGPWLVGMAKGMAPEGFEMGAFRFPTMPDALPGTETNLEGGVNSFAISTSSKNPEIAAEFLTAFGKANQDFVNTVDYRPSVPGVTVLDLALVDVVKLMEEANVMFPWTDRRLPPVVVDDFLNNLTAMFTKQITPEEFGIQMDAIVAEKIK